MKSYIVNKLCCLKPMIIFKNYFDDDDGEQQIFSIALLKHSVLFAFVSNQPKTKYIAMKTLDSL